MSDDKNEPKDETRLSDFLGNSPEFRDRLKRIHESISLGRPSIERIACAIYESESDELKTFSHSTRAGEPITNYHYKLRDSLALSELAKTRKWRVINDIRTEIESGRRHSDWLLKQGYESSFTLPLYDQHRLIGFIFFDSTQKNTFDAVCQRDLLLHCSLINVLLNNEIIAARSILASAHIARSFANLRDFETGAHLDRMARYAQLIARGVAPAFNLSDEFIHAIFRFSPLHDIGKVGIPDRILLKPGPLDPEERAIMETHVEKGVDVAKKIVEDLDLGEHPDSNILINIIHGHHEMLDGSGYPRHLKGDAIPIEARIVAVADIFDALTTKRPYKEPWPVQKANDELNRLVSAGKLDGHCVAALEHAVEEAGLIRDTYQDAE